MDRELLKLNLNEVKPHEDRVFFSKDEVFVHPSREEAISGTLFIIETFDTNEKCLAWTPYNHFDPPTAQSMNPGNRSSPAATKELYALKIPLLQIRSIKRYIPTIGIPHIIIISNGGIAFPPYYFHSGGVREFLAALREHVTLLRSDDEPNVFYLSDSAVDPNDPIALLRSSLDAEKLAQQMTPRSSLDVVPPTTTTTTVTTTTPSAAASANQPPSPHHPSLANVTSPRYPGEHRYNPNVETLSWSILENFSKVTQFARHATSGPSFLKELERHIAGTSTIPTIALPDGGKGGNIPDNKASQLSHAHSTSLGIFEMVEDEVVEIPKVERVKEMTAEEWISYFDEDGRINDEAKVRKQIFSGGVEPCIRIEVWKYLLKLYPWNSTYSEREAILKEKRMRYQQWKSLWKLIESDNECKFTKFKTRAHAIEKDVLRTDRNLEFYAGEDNPNLKSLNDILLTYVFFNFDLGYVQGMNEFLSPILYVMGEEGDAFWCFKGLLDSFESNFHKDQNGMHQQLVQLAKLVKCMDQGLYEYFEEHDCLNMFFSFRWLLIHFKREFSFATILRLWEVLWSNHLCPNFHLFVALAILLKCRSEIINNKMEFDDIVKHVNELAGKLTAEEILVEAEVLYHTFLRICDTGTDLKEEINKRPNLSAAATNNHNANHQ